VIDYQNSQILQVKPTTIDVDPSLSDQIQEIRKQLLEYQNNALEDIPTTTTTDPVIFTQLQDLQQLIDQQSDEIAHLKQDLLASTKPTFNISRYITRDPSNNLRFNRDQAWNDYLLFHAKSLQLAHRSDIKYVLYKVWVAGLGNRLAVLGDALFLAMITGRVLIVNWTEPCHINEIFETELRWNYDILLQNNPQLAQFIETSNIVFNVTNKPQLVEFLKYPDAFERLEPYQFIIIQHWRGFESLLADHPVVGHIAKTFGYSSSVRYYTLVYYF
jgi:hypothetical protein